MNILKRNQFRLKQVFDTAALGAIAAYGMEFYPLWALVGGALVAAQSIRSGHRETAREFARSVKVPQNSPIMDTVRTLAQRAGMDVPDVRLRRKLESAACAYMDKLYLDEDYFDSFDASSQRHTGVIAHELAHIRNRDSIKSAITGSLSVFNITAGSFNALASLSTLSWRSIAFALMANSVLAAASFLLNRHMSRQMEYESDLAGADINGSPEPMLEFFRYHRHDPESEGWEVLADEHPPINERIKNLESWRP